MVISFTVCPELSHTRPQLLYCNMQSLSCFLLTLKWMTLNGLASCLGISMSWVCVFWLLDKTVRNFAEL